MIDEEQMSDAKAFPMQTQDVNELFRAKNSEGMVL